MNAWLRLSDARANMLHANGRATERAIGCTGRWAAAALAVAPPAAVAEVARPQVAAQPQVAPRAAETQGEEVVGVERAGQPAAAVLLAGAALKPPVVRQMVAAPRAVVVVAAVEER
jgi:hypothetical protein